MRIWRFLFNLIQDSPPRFIEVLMLFLGTILLLIWDYNKQWPYLVLSLSYIIGSSLSILIRESFLPFPKPTLSQIIAFLLLVISVYSFHNLSYYF